MSINPFLRVPINVSMFLARNKEKTDFMLYIPRFQSTSLQRQRILHHLRLSWGQCLLRLPFCSSTQFMHATCCLKCLSPNCSFSKQNQSQNSPGHRQPIIQICYRSPNHRAWFAVDTLLALRDEDCLCSFFRKCQSRTFQALAAVTVSHKYNFISFRSFEMAIDGISSA